MYRKTTILILFSIFVTLMTACTADGDLTPIAQAAPTAIEQVTAIEETAVSPPKTAAQATTTINLPAVVTAETETVLQTGGIADTGQDNCYDNNGQVACPTSGAPFDGQDAQYDSQQPAYVDNGDGTITDLNTGMMWQQAHGEKVTWDGAMAAADGLAFAGYDDWRVPTIKELYSLIDFNGVIGNSAATSIPFIDTDYFAFNYLDSGSDSTGERYMDVQYWTDTEYVSTTMGDSATVFGVNFADGRIKGYPKVWPNGSGDHEMYVIYVRGDSSYGINEFVDNGNGTVTDNSSGLMWQQADDGNGRLWEESLAYCEALTLGGDDDWRLPNAKELQAIVDYGRSPDTTNSAAIDPIFATTSIIDPDGNVNYPYYWTNTSHLNGMQPGSFAVYIAFGEAQGFMEQPPNSGNYQLLDVHGAGSQRSDPKTGDTGDYPNGHGPQGDVIYIYNYSRCVRSN